MLGEEGQICDHDLTYRSLQFTRFRLKKMWQSSPLSFCFQFYWYKRLAHGPKNIVNQFYCESYPKNSLPYRVTFYAIEA